MWDRNTAAIVQLLELAWQKACAVTERSRAQSSDPPLPLWTEPPFRPRHCPPREHRRAQKRPHLAMKRRDFGCFLYVHGGTACSRWLDGGGAFEGSGRGSGPDPTVPFSQRKADGGETAGRAGVSRKRRARCHVVGT